MVSRAVCNVPHITNYEIDTVQVYQNSGVEILCFVSTMPLSSPALTLNDGHLHPQIGVPLAFTAHILPDTIRTDMST